MAQRLIGFNTNFELRDLSDVVINNPQDFDIIYRQGDYWVNIPIDTINPFTLKVQVVTENFVAQSNTIYIVNTKYGPITCMLPASPQVGDRIIFIDAKSDLAGTPCDTGWGTNPLTISANLNSTIISEPFITKTLDGDCFHLMYNVCDNWASMTPVTRQATEIIAGIARVATTDETIEGTSNLLIITPLKLTQALALHKEDILDTIFPLPDASETIKGILRYSTITEVLDGVLDNVGVSPARLTDRLNAFSPFNFTVQNDLFVQRHATISNTLTSDIGNFTTINVTNLNVLQAILFPFNVTFTATVDVTNASVVGLRESSESYKGVTRYSTQTEANGGTDNESAITPAKLKTVLDTRFPHATTSIYGITRLATVDETRGGIIESAVITPAAFKLIIQELLDALELALQTEINTLETELLAQVSNLQGQINTINSEIDSLTTRCDDLQTLITALQQADTLFQNKIDNLQALIDLLEAEDIALQSQITALQAAINAIQNTISNIQNTINGLQTKLLDLEGTLTSNYDEIIARLDSIDSAIQANVYAIQSNLNLIYINRDNIATNTANIATNTTYRENMYNGNWSAVFGPSTNGNDDIMDDKILAEIVYFFNNSSVIHGIQNDISSLNSTIASIDARITALEGV